MEIAKRKLLKSAKLTLFTNPSKTITAPCNESGGIEFEIKDKANMLHNERWSSTIVADENNLIELQKKQSRLSVDGYAWEVYLNPGDVTITAEWSWHAPDCEEVLKVKVLRFNSYDAKLREANFAAVHQTEVKSLHSISYSHIAAWVEKLPLKYAKETKKMLRLLLRDPVIEQSREHRRRALSKKA